MDMEIGSSAWSVKDTGKSDGLAGWNDSNGLGWKLEFYIV